MFGFIPKFKMMAEQYAIQGALPNIPPAKVEDFGITSQEDKSRLVNMVNEEGDEDLRYLLVNYQFKQKLLRIGYAKDFGMEALWAKFPSFGKEISIRNIAKAFLRVGIVTAIVAVIVLFQKGNFLSAGLAAGGLQALYEFWRFHRDEYLSKAFSWYMGWTKPQIWKDPRKLGERYIKGSADSTEMNHAISMARAIKRKACYDKTPTIDIGVASGHLRNQGIVSAPGMGTTITMSRQDMTTSMFIFGGTGSGKTTSILLPALARTLMSGDDSVVAFDVKRDFSYDAFAVMQGTDSNYHFRVIGPDAWQCTYNIFDRSINTPEQVASLLSDAISTEGGSGGDAYWNNSLVNLVKAGCHLLDAAEIPRNPRTVLMTITDEDVAKAMIEKVKLAGNVTPDLMQAIEHGFNKGLFKLSDNTKASVIGTVMSWMSDFAFPSMDNFAGDSNVSIMDIVNKKSFFLIDVPESLGLAGRLVRYFIFRQVYDAALKRLFDPSLNQRYIHMYVDECQEVTNERSFAKSALSRSAKLCVVAATQSRAQLLKTWKGKDNCDAVLANFRTKVFLSTDDEETRSYMKKLIAEGDAFEYSYSVSKTRGTSLNLGTMFAADAAGIVGGRAWEAILPGMSNSTSKSTTVSMKRGELRNEFFDSLGDTQCVAIINWGNCRRKSVLDVEPLYIPKSDALRQDLIDYHTSLMQEEGGLS